MYVTARLCLKPNLNIYTVIIDMKTRCDKSPALHAVHCRHFFLNFGVYKLVYTVVQIGIRNIYPRFPWTHVAWFRTTTVLALRHGKNEVT